MGQLGLGVMIQMLGGNEDSALAMQAAIGKKIASVALKNDVLRFVFEDGSKLSLMDEGQSCCESRYMTTDDDLTYYAGAELRGGEIQEAPEVEDGGEVHEVEFLVIHTDKGDFTMSSHNEHNGYYGGFCIRAK